MPSNWPFTSVLEPNLDTGPGAAVPTGSTSLTTDKVWLLGAHFTNPVSNVVPITVTVTDTAGLVLLKLEIPAGGEQPFEWPFRPTTGLKWSADVAGLLGHIWGYH